MASKPYKNIRGPLHIDTLSQKLKLKVSDAKRIERSKKPLRTSQPQSSAFADRCQNENNGLFQMFLRAGAKGHIKTFLKQQGLDILKSKFFIHTNLREIKRKGSTLPTNIIQDDSGEQSIPTQPEEEGSVVLESKGTKILSNYEIVICDESSNLVTNHNAKIHLNALHVAILAQQGRAVKCILNCIITDEKEDEQTKRSILLNILRTNIELENVSNISSDINNFTNDNLCLKGMNAFHLACQCFPKSIEIFSEMLCEHEGKCLLPVLETFITQLKNVVEGKNRDGYTPLHIAATKLSVESARYEFTTQC